MERLIALGTGNAMATRCYNTCFALQSDRTGTLLVDAGGGNGILGRLREAGIAVRDLHEMIVTHEHCDHILGTVWIVRAAGSAMLAGSEGDLTIWCHAGLEKAIRAMCGFTLQKKITDLFDRRIHFSTVADGTRAMLWGREFTFFSIHSTKAEQYGFTAPLANGAKLVCLGDEPYNEACAPYVQGADWLLSEAFCLYADRDRFRPYEKHHSTVRDAACLAQQLGAQHLVLWHTEDSDLAHRKARYTVEAQQSCRGEVFVPDDLEVIPLN